MPRVRFTFIFALAAAVSPAAAWPQGNPVGPEFRVNSFTTANQRYPANAVGGAGDFVVVWESNLQDGAGYGVFGQRYSGGGTPLGPEFRVNTLTVDSQRRPAVGADSAGNFVVVWESLNQDGSAYGVFGQRFAANGSPLGPEFRVNSSTPSDQRAPAVAVDGLGNFVVAWQSRTSQYEIFGQRYANSGVPLGAEFRVNTSSLGPQDQPAVAADAAGNFAVIWRQNTTGARILGQRYSSSGSPLGAQFAVSQPCYPCSVFTPAVACDPPGNFVVVWWRQYPYGGANNWIAGQRYASSGAPLGGLFRVNTYNTNFERDPAVATDAAGNFVVVWESDGAQDGSFGGVFGQRFASSGAPLGPEFLVNTYTTQTQWEPAVAADPTGNFVVTWTSVVQDGSQFGVYGQRYNRIVPVELMRFQIE